MVIVCTMTIFILTRLQKEKACTFVQAIQNLTNF